MSNYNWENKNERAKIAQTHTNKMYKDFGDEIKDCIANTKIYNTKFSLSRDTVENKSINIIIEDLTSTDAIKKYKRGKTAVLNFASYKKAGGMFLNGSRAQEECLCHDSFLFNVLTAFEEKYYAKNRQHKNGALYFNRALYSPDIIFFNDEEKYPCDVITCASPNKTAAQKYCNVSDAKNTDILNSRIKYVLDIAEDNNVDTLILGAFGCGVFGQSATEVARIFKENINNYSFKTVIFAIPSGNNTNLSEFQMVFKTERK